jgi:hypothetical protein
MLEEEQHRDAQKTLGGEVAASLEALDSCS